MSSKNKQIDAYESSMDQNYQLARKAMNILIDAGHEARMAGGCVRDRLMKVRPKDYDIATVAKPEQVRLIFKQKNIRTVPTGIAHGTITVIMGGQALEITSLRRDVDTDGRRAVVAFGESFEEDSHRRDFTINALYEDIEGKVYDYHNGQSDLSLGILRFVGDAETRIREDYLRILRFFRFLARLGFQAAPGTLEAISKEVRGLQQMSRERITSELLLTLESSGFPKVLAQLYTSGALEVTMSLLKDDRVLSMDWGALDLYKKAETSIARLAALLWYLPDLNAKAATLERLRLSRAQREKIMTLFGEALPRDPRDPGEVYEWLDRIEQRHSVGIWQEWLLPVWTVLRPDAALGVMDRTIAGNLQRRDCPLSGQFLIESLGMKPGPELGERMAELKRTYRRGLWTTESEALIFFKMK